MAKRNFIPLVPSGTINADASVAQLEQDVLAMDAKVGELAEDIGDTEQEINQLKSQITDYDKFMYTASAKDFITEQGGITITTGADNDSSSIKTAYSRSGYIPVYVGYEITYTGVRVGQNLVLIAVYDTDKVYKSAESVEASSAAIIGGKGTVTINRNGFVRLSCRNAELSGATFTMTSKVGVNQANTDTKISRLGDFGISTVVPMTFDVGWINSSTGAVETGASAIITPTEVTLTGEIVIRKIKAAQLDIFEYVSGSLNARTGLSEGVAEKRFTPTEGATYRFCYYRIPYETATVADFVTDFAIAYTANEPIFASKFSDVAGKKWVTLGDSLTDPVTLSGETGDETKNYTDIVAERLGLTLVNDGNSGSGYWRHSTVSPYEGFYQVAETIATDADIVTIFGSFNDMGKDGETSGSTILGTIYDDTTETVGGCINQTFLNLFERVPDAVIGVILPTPWNDMTITKEALDVYEPYVNLVKGVAERYSLPVLDLFHHSNLRPWDEDFRTDYYIASDDGVHPNHYGHMRIAGYIADFVESLAKLN